MLRTVSSLAVLAAVAVAASSHAQASRSPTQIPRSPPSAPNAAVQPTPALPVAAGDAAFQELGVRIAACFGREDPVCAEPLVANLVRQAATSTSTAYCQGLTDFLAGRLEPARTALQRVAGSPMAPAVLRERAQSYLELVESSLEVQAGMKSHSLAGGRATVHLRPGPDEVLLPYLDRVLRTALPGLDQAFGALGSAPVQLHILGRAADLGRLSGLTVEQIRTSGTIALCKHNRVLLTSPADLVFGYPWADTVVHELVHYYVIKRGGPDVPVWLHEGLARAFEGVWRGQVAAVLGPEERRVLSAARKKGRFVPLAKMSPSLALLRSQEDTQLAFAEVHHAVAWLLARASQDATTGRAGDAAAPGAHAGRLVGLFGAGLGESEALQRFGGLTPAAFQVAWKRDLLKLDLPAEASARSVQPLVFRGVAAPRDASHQVKNDARRFAELGDRLAVQKRPQAAAIEYRKALAAGPNDGALLVARLVRVLLDLGRNDEAVDLLGPALEDDPEHAPLHVLAGRAAVAMGRFKEAVDALERAAWINPFDPQVHALAAQAFASLGQEGDAAAARAREGMVQGVGQ